MHIIKQSEIHGRGLFASTTIGAGDHIGSYEGPYAKRNSPYVLWFTEEGGAERGILGRNALRFVNHSTRPNAEFCGPDLNALVPIAEGNEITCHYGPEWEAPSRQARPG